MNSKTSGLSFAGNETSAVTQGLLTLYIVRLLSNTPPLVHKLTFQHFCDVFWLRSCRYQFLLPLERKKQIPQSVYVIFLGWSTASSIRCMATATLIVSRLDIINSDYHLLD